MSLCKRSQSAKSWTEQILTCLTFTCCLIAFTCSTVMLCNDCTQQRPLSVLLFRLPTVNLNLKSFQAKWNNENIPSSASEPLCIMYSQERENAALCQDRRDSGGDNASFSSPSSSSGIGFPLKRTDTFDFYGAASVFAARALFKREEGKKNISSRYYISMPADETEVSVSSPVPFGIPALSVVTPDIPVHVERKSLREYSLRKSAFLILY